MDDSRDRQSEPVYDARFLVGLGLLSFEYARLENTLRRLVGTLLTPHKEVAFTATKNTNADTLSSQLKELIRARLPSGTLREAMLDWLANFNKLRKSRNELIHPDWAAYASVFAARSLSDGIIVTELREVSASEIYDLAHSAWALSQEGNQLDHDLVRAGLATQANISHEHIIVTEATTALQIVDAPLGGRPSDPMSWPGIELRQQFDAQD